MTKSDFKFCFPFRVRYAETDAQGIVFFAHYLTYFDTAINEYLRDLPHNYIEHVQQTGTDFHVVKVTVEFYAPSHFDDEIEVYVRTGRIGRSSLTFFIEIFPKNG
ncbi:MAG: acyl-CoA thioesterase, partial [Deltaproteobacteria bacterium]|nr:acyl-CoA thioesterase [Deltaproteobacteria bacterium]